LWKGTQQKGEGGGEGRGLHLSCFVVYRAQKKKKKKRGGRTVHVSYNSSHRSEKRKRDQKGKKRHPSILFTDSQVAQKEGKRGERAGLLCEGGREGKGTFRGLPYYVLSTRDIEKGKEGRGFIPTYVSPRRQERGLRKREKGKKKRRHPITHPSN